MTKTSLLLATLIVLASLGLSSTGTHAAQDPRCYTTMTIPTNAARVGRQIHGSVRVENKVVPGTLSPAIQTWTISFQAATGTTVPTPIVIRGIYPGFKKDIPLWAKMTTKESSITVMVKADGETIPCAKQTKKIYQIPDQTKNVPIYSVTPSPVKMGSLITITGWGFADNPARKFVVFDDSVTFPRQSASEIISWTNTQIVVRVPTLKYPTLTRKVMIGYYLETMPNGFEDFSLANAPISIAGN